MNDPLIEKIKTIVEGLASPAYPFVNDSFQNLNVILDATYLVKTAALLLVKTGTVTIEGNGLFDKKDLALMFIKPMQFEDYKSNMIETDYELFTDMLDFIRTAYDDKDIVVDKTYAYSIDYNAFDLGSVVLTLEFKAKLTNGLTVYPEC